MILMYLKSNNMSYNLMHYFPSWLYCTLPICTKFILDKVPGPYAILLQVVKETYTDRNMEVVLFNLDNDISLFGVD